MKNAIKIEEYHDPSEYIKGIQQLLISDKKRIGFLFGAGTSFAKKENDSANIPAIGEMTKTVVDSLSNDKEYEFAISQIQDEIGEEKFTIESLLTCLELKRQAVGNGKINGLNKEKIGKLISQIKDEIKKIVSIHNSIVDFNKIIHVDFAEWILKANRKYGIEIFTTNYDYLFELGLEYKGVHFYDGFTGSYRPFFNAESIDDLNFLSRQTKLWKIHGSLGWIYNEDQKQVIRKDTEKEDILIYPSTLKYDNSKKYPYVALGDRLTNFLKQPDTVLFTCGYSFGDEHINERIITALSTNTTAHVYILNYDKNFNENAMISKFAKENYKVSIFSQNAAIIGGKYAKWKLKKEPDEENLLDIQTYFNLKRPEDGIYSGEGEMILPDFVKLIYFLKNMSFII